jgi:hypothetical protein
VLTLARHVVPEIEVELIRMGREVVVPLGRTYQSVTERAGATVADASAATAEIVVVLAAAVQVRFGS